jgi:hypothetical protein
VQLYATYSVVIKNISIVFSLYCSFFIANATATVKVFQGMKNLPESRKE